MRSQHDRSYKLLHNFPVVIESFLRGFGVDIYIPIYLLDVFNYATLIREPTDNITSSLGERFGDRLWRIYPSAKGVKGLAAQMRWYAVTRKRRTVWRPIFLMFEFQSDIDKNMHARIAQYVQLLYEDLIRRGELKPGDELPLVIPIIIYIGKRPWPSIIDQAKGMNLALEEHMLRTGYFLKFDVHAHHPGETDLGLFSRLIRLEQATTRAKAVEALESIFQAIPSPEMRRLRLAFYLRACVLSFWSKGFKGAPSFVSIDRAFSGGTMPQVIQTPYERDINNAERKGIRKGISLERQESLARERNLLRRQAAKQFDAKIADHLAVLLDRVDEPERLEDIGELIVSSKTGPQLLKRVEKSPT